MSTNGGAAWKQLNQTLDEGYAVVTVPGSVFTGGCLVDSALSKMAVIKLTIDGTLTNTSILSSEAGEVKAMAVHPINSSIVYAGGTYRDISYYNCSRLYKTINGGSSWFEIGKTSFNIKNDGVYGLCVDPSNPAKLLAATNLGVLVSENEGTTWSSAAQKLNCTSLLPDPLTPNRYFLGTRTGVYISIDGGKSWQQLGGQLTATPVLSLAYDKIAKVLYAGTEGQGVYRYSLSTTNVASAPFDVPDEFALYQNYPNPFNPLTIIDFQLPITTMVTLSVFDLLGREVAILVNEEKTAGRYSVSWNASNTPSGIYFYRLLTGDANHEPRASLCQTKRMIILR
ncbi:MAG: T9SS type A sorting domain-containing protein [bacterium]